MCFHWIYYIDQRATNQNEVRVFRYNYFITLGFGNKSWELELLEV